MTSPMDDLRQASADVSGVEVFSPAARAVFESFNSKFDWVEDGVPGPQFHSIAAALRAVADGWRAEVGGITQTDFIRGVLRSAEALDEIAAELEGAQ